MILVLSEVWMQRLMVGLVKAELLGSLTRGWCLVILGRHLASLFEPWLNIGSLDM